jgi:hypothetical protein
MTVIGYTHEDAERVLHAGQQPASEAGSNGHRRSGA